MVWLSARKSMGRGVFARRRTAGAAASTVTARRGPNARYQRPARSPKNPQNMLNKQKQ
jgi:hypothetical protein